MAAEDLTTVAAVKQQIDTTATSSDALIGALITPASVAIMNWSGRRFAPLEAAPGSARVFPLLRASSGIYEVWVGDLSSAPTAAAITDDLGGSPVNLTPGTDLVLLPRVRQAWQPIERIKLAGNVIAPVAGSLLSVTGRWGFPSVPKDVEQACIVTVRAWLRSDSASSAEYGYDEGGRVVQVTPEGGWMLPRAAKQMLEDYLPPHRRRRAMTSVPLRGF